MHLFASTFGRYFIPAFTPDDVRFAPETPSTAISNSRLLALYGIFHLTAPDLARLPNTGLGATACPIRGPALSVACKANRTPELLDRIASPNVSIIDDDHW